MVVVGVVVVVMMMMMTVIVMVTTMMMMQVPMFYTDLGQLAAHFTEMEEDNLFLMQRCQTMEEQFEEVMAKHDLKERNFTADASALKATIRELHQQMQVEQDRRAALLAAAQARTHDPELENSEQHFKLQTAEIRKVCVHRAWHPRAANAFWQTPNTPPGWAVRILAPRAAPAMIGCGWLCACAAQVFLVCYPEQAAAGDDLDAIAMLTRELSRPPTPHINPPHPPNTILTVESRCSQGSRSGSKRPSRSSRSWSAPSSPTAGCGTSRKPRRRSSRHGGR
jgi:hypothetical protein